MNRFRRLGRSTFSSPAVLPRVRHIRKHEDPSVSAFLKRTVSAQLHLLGAVIASIGLAVLLGRLREEIEPEHVWACAIFGATSILVFATSAAYHLIGDGFRISNRLESWLEDLDHFAIFLFIAGTYTPFIINVIQPPWDTPLLILIWSCGVAGIAYTHLRPRLPKWAQSRIVYTGIFVLMGWTLVIRLGEAMDRMTFRTAFLLTAGGLSYTVGAGIYALKKPNLFPGVFGFHELWHVMVLLGYGFHYFMILDFYS